MRTPHMLPPTAVLHVPCSSTCSQHTALQAARSMRPPPPTPSSNADAAQMRQQQCVRACTKQTHPSSPGSDRPVCSPTPGSSWHLASRCSRRQRHAAPGTGLSRRPSVVTDRVGLVIACCFATQSGGFTLPRDHCGDVELCCGRARHLCARNTATPGSCVRQCDCRPSKHVIGGGSGLWRPEAGDRDGAGQAHCLEGLLAAESLAPPHVGCSRRAA
jgi:hypothetical protein